MPTPTKRKSLGRQLRKRPLAPKYRWTWSRGRDFGGVETYTRSEARALVKAALGLPRRKRLPADMKVWKAFQV